MYAANLRLPRYLALAYALLTAYACLHPFSGWRDTGSSPLAFLIAPWPRYSTYADLWLNALGFMPLGFMIAASLRLLPNRKSIIILVMLMCTLLSGSLEFAQNYLPTRVASNLDLASNIFGGWLGAMLALRWGGIFDHHGALSRW